MAAKSWRQMYDGMLKYN